MNAGYNKLFMKVLMFIALLPMIPPLVTRLTPAGLVLLGFIALFAIPSLRRGVGSLVRMIFGGLFTGIIGTLKVIFGGIFAILAWLFGFGASPSRFMGWFERSFLLRSSHDGFLVDGKSSRLSESASYESLLIQGGMGRGKSSTFVMPNLLNPPKSKPSFVILDTSGEIYRATSGYLKRQGYAIRTLNLMHPGSSESYNPLEAARTQQDIADLAKTLIASSNGGQRGSDPFWEQAAEKLIRVLAQCLMNQPDPQYRNLANLRHLVTGFDAHVAQKGQLAKIDRFVLGATQNDPATFASYQAFVQGNLKTIQSVLMSADVALDPLATPEMAALTATNSLLFNALRQGPTALYVIVNQTQMQHHAFLLNLFYADLFRSLLKDHHNPGRPVWLFLDEFGHLQIPGFEIFATTARKYKVAFALFLQSMGQLEGRYGPANARTIREGLGTEIYLPGMALETARELEGRLGRADKAPLMAASDIIRMKEHEALMLHSNRLPVMLRTRRYFKDGTLKRRSRRRPAPLPQLPGGQPPMIPL